MNLFKIALPSGSCGEKRFERSGYSDLPEGSEGFIYSAFGEDMPLRMIPYDDTLPPLSDDEIRCICMANDSAAGLPRPHSTPRSEHLALVERFIGRIKELEAVDGKPSKIIAARVELKRCGDSPAALWRSLRDAYPDAAVFLFSTPSEGTWIGASPELLLKIADGELRTMSLAGTRPATPDGQSTPEWDSKNREEQQIVSDFIIRMLRRNGLDPQASLPYTRRAGRVEHICTDISAPIADTAKLIADGYAMRLISHLAPTPALSGYPRHEAVEFINLNESNPRGCYGGTIGYVSPRRAEAYVNLRSGRLLTAERLIALYAGGGITRHSIPAEEWEETCRKLTTLTLHL